MGTATTSLIVLALTCSLFAQSTEDTQSEDGTPAAAIESFFGALLKGDAEKATTFLMSPKKMTEYCRTQVELYKAFRHLGDAAEKHFGEDGKALRLPIPASLVSARLKEVQPEENGETAVWKSNPKVPMTLHRIDGHWKLDMYSSYKKPIQVKLTNQLFQRITEYTNTIANEISKGRFDTVQEVQQELKRQRTLMNEEMVPKLRKAG